MSKSITFFLQFILLPLLLSAQFPFSKKIDIEEENLTLRANVLLKDHNGFLWIGTSEGVFKYNGTVPQKIPGSAAGSKMYVTALYEDADGMIWAGCKDGTVMMLTNGQPVHYSPGEQLPKTAITAILQDAAKRIWFATAGDGIYYKEGNQFRHITTDNGLSDDNVNCLYSPDGKQLVAGTDRGISFITWATGKISISFFTSKNGLPDNIVRCIVPSQQTHIVWVGMQAKGVLLFDLSKKTLADTTAKTAWAWGQVNDIYDTRGEIFIATEQNGVICYNPKNKNYAALQLKDSVYVKRITDIQTDNEENIWLAAENRLVNFTGTYLKYWYGPAKPPFVKIHTLFADEDNTLWFTPDFRLYKSDQLLQNDNGTLKGFDITPPQELVDITCIYKDRFGYLWIGTMGKGIVRMNAATGARKAITEDPVVSNGHILSIAGKGDEVWVSTLNGVARFNLTENNDDLQAKINFTNYTKKDGLGSDYIYHILIDSKNRVWFATDGAGVSMYEHNLFMNFYQGRMFPSKVAYSLAEDKHHHIWISTYNDGLFEYDEKKFTQYGIKDGLTDLAITSIAIDEYNNVIAVHKKGMDVFNPRKKTVQHFGAESGFSEQQPNLNSVTKDTEGNLWIGTENGIVRFASQPSFSNFTPLAVIENVLLFNIPVNTATDSSFNYDENNFTFVFAAAYYKAPEKIKFQYWLENYSKNWETTADKTVNFPQLHPGNYKLRVRASANDNFESAPIAVYAFNITRSYWTTWWFRILVLLCTAGLVYLFFKQRIKIIRKKEYAEREKFQLQYDALKNQVNPHFLFNSFNALLNIVEDNPKEAAVLIKHLSQFYRKMTAYSQKELILLGEELELLDSYLYIQQKRYGSALQFSVDIEPWQKKSTFIPPLVLQLLAENAVKHNTISKDKPLYISIFTEGEFLVIKNSINYKLEKEESEGVGLQNIRNRYRLLTEKQIIQKEDGASFIILLPIIYLN